MRVDKCSPFGQQDQTVIGTTFDVLECDGRIEDVYVSTNKTFAADFETYIAESGYDKAPSLREETVAEDEKFSVVGALAQLVDRENLTDDTLVTAGDNIVSFDIADFLDTLAGTGEPILAAYDAAPTNKISLRARRT